ncbi:MAG: transcription termination/antitermination protein NusA [Clostridia bacterium]|nr:transcription termination/antitermination protein NusA [Deltaproteobacteria bacterium]
MDANLNLVLDQVSKDKGIDKSILLRALEEAILVSAKRAFGAERNLNVAYNEEKGGVDLSQTIKVVEKVEDSFNELSVEEAKERAIEVDAGEEMVFPIYYLDQDAAAAREQDETYGDILRLKTFRRGFGRIAAQTAKQVIIQRIRDAERNIVYDEYKDRRGELVTGIVRRFERGNIIVDLGRAEAILPLREQCPRESYRAGDRVQAFVIEVQEHSRGPQIVLSRTTPELLVKLFELEVPEIYEGIVRIESAAREPGARAKIAVSSSDRDVDPVGACVGMKGSRVQAVVQELRGEKIDIVPYSEDPATFVCNALQPAEVSRVLIDESNHRMEIIVPDDQLSLAIGRKGQNVRLASQLSGWRLDIHSESRIGEIRDRAWKSLTKIEGINEFLIQTLYNHGIRSAQDFMDSDRSFLEQFPGMTEEVLQKVLESASNVADGEKKEDEQSKRDQQRANQAADWARKLQELMKLDDMGRLRLVRGIGEASLDALVKNGFSTVEAIAEADMADLQARAGINDKKAKQLKYSANQRLKLEREVRDEATASGVTVVNGTVRLPGDGHDVEASVASDAMTAPVTSGRAEA